MCPAFKAKELRAPLLGKIIGVGQDVLPKRVLRKNEFPKEEVCQLP